MKRLLVFICALFVFGACHAATLNIQNNGNKTKILLDTTQRTKPALAMRINGEIYYANLDKITSRTPGEIYVSYDGKTYAVKDNSKYKFTITTTEMPAGTEFRFEMSAAGNFTVDWGDGTVDKIVRTNTTLTTYSHEYKTSDVYKIGFDGLATGYSTSVISTIRFYGNTNIIGISGSLGAIFPTIGTGVGSNSKPRFFETFYNCAKLVGNIPENLFNGVKGATNNMFCKTFYGCSGLTGEIPPNLFSGISGAADYLLNGTFQGCVGLTGDIPSELFSGVSGAATGMFQSTFRFCSGLTGIPANLFHGVKGAANYLFSYTFEDCSGLTGTIPSGFFGNVSGTPAYYMFDHTFYGCANLYGPTARMADGTYLYDIVNPSTGKTWYEQSPDTFKEMYINTGITGVR